MQQSPYSKDSSQEIITQMKVAVTSMISHCTELRFSNSKSNVSWSIKQAVNFGKQPIKIVFLFFAIMVLSKVVYILKISQHTKFHDTTLTGAKFCIHLKSLNVRHFGMDKTMGLKLRRRCHVQWHKVLRNFINIYLWIQKLMGKSHTNTQRRMWFHFISLLFYLRKESRLKMHNCRKLCHIINSVLITCLKLNTVSEI
jgi:hypothetical protein